MRLPIEKGTVIREIFIFIFALLLIVFMCRIWPILLLMILVLFGWLVFWLFRICMESKKTEPQPIPVPTKKPLRIPTQEDVLSMAYSVILRRITEIVRAQYPQARWVFEASNARRKIDNSDEVYILLNRAGGYSRAKVIISNLQVIDIEFVVPETEEIAESTEADDLDDSEELPENYELVAYEWVEKHIMELNTRCNEVLGEGKTSVLIAVEELPGKESWLEICKQLKKNQIENLECVPEGILINLKQ